MPRVRLLPAADRLARFALNRRGLRSRMIGVRGGAQIHVYEGAGQGSLPPVVLIHGLGANGSGIAALAARLQPHVRHVVVPELTGHGFSTRGDEPVTPELLLEALDTVIGKVLHEPAVVYGNSLGGALAIKYAGLRPSLVRGLVLASPAGAAMDDDDWADLVRAFDITNKRAARGFLSRLYHRAPWFVPLLARELPEVLGKPAVREILASVTPADAVTAEELAALSMPILFLWGRSEKLLPPSALAYFRAHLPPHAVIEQPEGYGHTPQTEVPGRVASRVLAFLGEVDRNVRAA